ncbi:MAG: PKD domain-containing protein, partial [Methylophagaceae bacterium]
TCGLKTVYLTVTDSLGCSDTHTADVNVYCEPISYFDFQNVCLDSTIYFTDQSTYVAAQNTWLWDFGDGNTSTLQNPNHTYTSCDTFIVSLTITDSLGCQDTWDTTVVVHCPPVITVFNTDVQGLCANDSTEFSINYNTGDTNIVAWLLDFGDGINTISSSTNVYHQYDSCNVNNLFTATYTITDNNGCIDIETTQIEVYCLPEISLATAGENACHGNNSAFASSNNVFYGGEIFLWEFGNGITQIFNTDPIQFEYEYPDYGNYWAVLTITDTNECSSSDSVNVTIFENPSAEVTTNNACYGNSTLFSAIYNQGDSIIGQYNWDFGNNLDTNISSTNFDYEFNNCGDTNWVELELISTTIDDNNVACQWDTLIPVVVYCLPSISLLPVSDTCEGINSIITFDTTAGTNPIEFWNWDYGGSIVSSDDSSYVLYSSCDDYLLTVEVQDSAQCSAIDSVDITVLCNTVPEFTLSNTTTCGDETIIAIAIDTTLEYTWSTQPYDPAFVNSFNPANSSGVSQFYMWENIFTSNPGPDSTLYTISAFEVDNFCSATIEHTVTVYPTPIINFVIDTFSCSPLILDLPNNNSDPNNGSETINSMTFEWYINTTLQNDTLHLTDTLLNTNIDYTTCYDIVLIGTTQHDCINSSSNEICIKPDPIAEIDFPDSCFCASFNTSLLNIS